MKVMVRSGFSLLEVLAALVLLSLLATALLPLLHNLRRGPQRWADTQALTQILAGVGETTIRQALEAGPQPWPEDPGLRLTARCLPAPAGIREPPSPPRRWILLSAEPLDGGPTRACLVRVLAEWP